MALGILLPTMHQSSLGTLMIIAGQKVSPLWQTQFLPLLFLMSAITMGYAVTVFESLLSSIAFKRPFETPILAKVSAVMFWFVVRLSGGAVRRPGDPGTIWQHHLTDNPEQCHVHH